MGERKSLTAEIEIVDESSATQLQYSTDAGNSVAVSYMQSVTPAITIGGKDNYVMSEHVDDNRFLKINVGLKPLDKLFYYRCRPIFYEKESHSDWLWVHL